MSSTAPITIPAQSAAKAAADGLRPEHKLVIWLLVGSAFVVFLNETVVGVALPRIMESLTIDAASAQWLMTAYMLTMAVVIPMSGFLIRRFSTRRIFLAAMTLFVVGTTLCSIAPGFEVLVGGRVVQALGNGVMMPLLMTTTMELVPPRDRGRMMGRVAVVMAAAPALGPMLGGLVLSWFDWRAIFVIILPIAVAALVIGFLKVRDVLDPENVRTDALSIILSAIGFGGLVFGLTELGHAVEGTAMVEPLYPVLGGLVALALFVWRQLRLQREDRALIDLRILAVPGYLWSILCVVMLCAILFGTIVLLPIYTQQSLGYSEFESGLMLLPGGLLMGFAGPVVGRWYDRVGPRPLVIPGAVIATGALILMSTFYTVTATFWTVVGLHLLLSAGLALLFSPLFTSGLGALDHHLLPYGSAMLGTTQQLAGAAGTAALIAIYTLTSSGAIGAGASQAEAIAAGVHTSYLVAGIAFVIVIGLAFLVRRPEGELDPAHAPAH